MKILEKHYAKLFNNNIYKLERKPAYIVVFWWEFLAVNISNLKKKAT